MKDMSESIVISFADSGGMQAVVLPCVGRSPLPSGRAASEVQTLADACRAVAESRHEEELLRLCAGNVCPGSIAEMLADMEADSEDSGTEFSTLSGLWAGSQPPGPSLGEEPWGSPAPGDQSWTDEDLYELHETRAAKINFEIKNRAEERVKDACIKVSVGSHDGRLVVVDKPRLKASEALPATAGDVGSLGYPEVALQADNYVVTDAIGDIDRGVPTKAFQSSLRVVLANELAGAHIPITVELLASNLAQPVVSVLYVDAFDDMPDGAVN